MDKKQKLILILLSILLAVLTLLGTILAIHASLGLLDLPHATTLRR